MDNLKSVSQREFDSTVLQSPTPVLVDFWAPRCSYCVKLSPILDELSEELENQLSIVKLNVDENRELAQQYGVMGLPTMILFKNGEKVEQLVGYMPKKVISDKIVPLL